jgi:multiple sugar transport system ATP-binding protein
VLSGKAAAAVAKRPKGADLLIGFRPEHLDVTDGRGDVVKIPARVDVVEYLGNEELIHAQAEGNEIVALIPSDRNVKPGSQIELSAPIDKLHVFDPETEQSLV